MKSLNTITLNDDTDTPERREESRNAALTVCELAGSAEAAHEPLMMLGLIDTPAIARS